MTNKSRHAVTTAFKSKLKASVHQSAFGELVKTNKMSITSLYSNILTQSDRAILQQMARWLIYQKKRAF